MSKANRERRLADAQRVALRAKAEGTASRVLGLPAGTPPINYELEELTFSQALKPVDLPPANLPTDYDLKGWTARQGRQALEALRRFNEFEEEEEWEESRRQEEYSFEVRRGEEVLARFQQYVDARSYMQGQPEDTELVMVNNLTKATTLVYTGSRG